MKHLSRPALMLIAVLLLASCGPSLFIARTTTTTYLYEGKTYQVVDHASNVHNFTLFEIVDGERKFSGFYTIDPKGDTPPEEQENQRRIKTIVEKGEKIGEPEKETQRSFDLDLSGD